MRQIEQVDEHERIGASAWRRASWTRDRTRDRTRDWTAAEVVTAVAVEEQRAEEADMRSRLRPRALVRGLARPAAFVLGWFRAHSYAPGWLPSRWQHVLAGYILAGTLQILAALVSLVLPRLVPNFAFLGLLELLVVAVVAVSWGAGPSILATLLGAALLEWVVLPLSFGAEFRYPGDLLEVGWFMLVGLALGAVAGQTEGARRRAMEEHAEARAREAALHELSQRTDEFLSLASHELRSPLTGIKSTLQLTERRLGRLVAAESVSVEELRRQVGPLVGALAGAEQQVDRQNRLIGDLLDVTRIRAGKLAFRFAPTDLGALVGEVVQEQRVAWPERSIAVSAPEQAVSVQADADRITQVVTNLLTNALKYSPPDRPVEVGLRAEGDEVRVLVRDQGPGLTAEQQRHIFERFHRVPGIKQQSGSGVGLGLGLYIVRSIVERHGGQLGVESTAGRGSTFWFSIPSLRD